MVKYIEIQRKYEQMEVNPKKHKLFRIKKGILELVSKFYCGEETRRNC